MELTRTTAPRERAKMEAKSVPPDDWSPTRMSQIGTTYGGLTGKTKAAFGHGPARYVTFLNVIENVRIDPNILESVDVAPTESQNEVLCGDLLFNGTSETPGDVALASVVLHQIPGLYLNSFCFGFRIRSPKHYHGEFLAHYFRSPPGRQLVAVLAQGATRYNVSKRQFLELALPLPQPSEQRDIAKVLSDADELLAALDALIAKKQAIKHAAMQQLITGRTRMPGFSGKWETMRLGEFATIRNQKVMPSRVDPDTPCVELEHLGQGSGRLTEPSTARDSVSLKYHFCAGDVLFGRLRPYLRKYWLADRDGICTTEIWPLIPDPALAHNGFLLGIVQTDQFIETSSISYGTHMPRADWGVMCNFEVQLPGIEEQIIISKTIFDMDAEIAALEARRDKTYAIKLGMMQQLLTGRIRLFEPTMKPEASA